MESIYHQNETTLHPVAAAVTILLSLVVLLVPRRHVLVPFFLLACFVSPAQRFVIATLDFHLMRILLLVGWARILLRGETKGMRLTTGDWIVIAWILVGSMAYVLLHTDTGALVNRAGRTYDLIGLYLLVRCCLRSWKDLDRLTSSMAWIALPVFVAFVIERSSGRNPFAVFGGVPEVTTIREGRLRCQGPFQSPILAGFFWAALLPLVASRWWRSKRGRGRVLLSLGAVCTTIVLTASSTSALGLVAVTLGGSAYLIRRQLGLVRMAVVVMLVLLHVVMKAPVWHLISRIDLAGGSTGYHRYALVDNFIRRFGEWWLFGVRSTDDWGYDMWDTANQFVYEGTEGGFLTLVLFVAVLVLSFRAVGRLVRRTRSKYERAIIWGCGVSLFAMSMMFVGISISHSQQTLLGFLLIVAAIQSLERIVARRTAHAVRRHVVSEASPRWSASVPAGARG